MPAITDNEKAIQRAARARRRRWPLTLCLIFMIAFGARAFAGAVFTGVPTVANDAGWYDAFGRGIANGDGYVTPDGAPTSRWPPGYPFFLGGIYRVTDESRSAAGLVQSLAGALTAVLIAELARRLFSVRAGVFAGCMIALMPGQILYAPLIMSETLFTMLLVATLLLASMRSGVAAALCGVSLALATLVRAQAVVILPAIGVLWWAQERWTGIERAAALRDAAILIGVAAIALTPWTVRNAVQLDTFEPVATNLGLNLWMGNNPKATGAIMAAPPVAEFDRKIDGLSNPEAEVTFNRLARNGALKRIARHPAEFLRRAPRKVFETYKHDHSFTGWYEPVGSEYLSDTARVRIELACDVAYYLLLALAVGGAAVMVARAARHLAFPAAAVACWTLLSVVFFGDPRFHVPIVPVIALPAAWLLGWLSAPHRMLRSAP